MAQISYRTGLSLSRKSNGESSTTPLAPGRVDFGPRPGPTQSRTVWTKPKMPQSAAETKAANNDWAICDGEEDYLREAVFAD
jgi:hypothetical protein